MQSQTYIGLHVKYRNSSDFNGTRILSTYFQKIIKYQIPWKFDEWDQSSSTQIDGWTDMTKIIVVFQIVANVPKNGTRDILVFTYCVLETYNHEKKFFQIRTCTYNEN